MEEKTATYAIIGASIIGIIIVAFLVITGIPSGSYFSELYFEDHKELPSGVDVGSKQTFSFTVVSHEKNLTAYSFNVTFGGRTIERGSFSLNSGEKKTEQVSFVPQESTLCKVKTENSTEKNTINISQGQRLESKVLIVGQNGSVKQIEIEESDNIFVLFNNNTWTGNNIQRSFFHIENKTDNRVLIVGQNGSVKQIKINKSDIVLVQKFDRESWPVNGFQIPVKIPIGEQEVTKVSLDPNLEEEYEFTYSTKKESNSSISASPFFSSSELDNISSYGYDLINKKVKIKNDRGEISIIQNTEVEKYKYKKKKIQVNVVNDLGKQYEIHFWTMVRG